MYTGTPATRSGAEWPVHVPSPSCPKLLLPRVHTEVARALVRSAKRMSLPGTGRVVPALSGARRSPGLQRLPDGAGCHVCSEAIWSASQRAGGVAAAVAASAAVRRWRSASGMASAWCRAAAVSLTS